MRDKKVVVVGAGCAGLSATYTLRKHGIDEVTFEANEVAGGRCRSFTEQGYTFSVGAQSTEPQWRTTFEYLNELGLMDKVYTVKKQRLGFFVKGKVRTAFMGGNLWETIKTMPENIRFFFTGLPLRTYPQVIKTFLALRRYMKLVDTKTHNFEALAEISNMSTEEFVLKHGGPEAVEWVFHPFLATMVLGRPRDISIAHPISLFSLMKGMCCLTGGLGTLTAALYEEVKDSVRLSTPVNKIVIENNKVRGVETKDGFVEADYVICAVDAVLARQLIPDLPETMRKPLETCKYSSTYYHIFGLEEDVMPGDVDATLLMIPAGANTPICWVSRGSRAHEKPMMICATRGWEDEKLARLSSEERCELVIKEIQKFYPKFPDKPVITKVYRWDRAVNLESPGQFVAIHDLLQNHMRDVKGLYLAGEYLFLIASTEGALMTGKQAAQMAIDDLHEVQ